MTEQIVFAAVGAIGLAIVLYACHAVHVVTLFARRKTMDDSKALAAFDRIAMASESIAKDIAIVAANSGGNAGQAEVDKLTNLAEVSATKSEANATAIRAIAATIESPPTVAPPAPAGSTENIIETAAVDVLGKALGTKNPLGESW